jgi:glycosyltransferase involved in cell wall biosynthesis
VSEAIRLSLKPKGGTKLRAVPNETHDTRPDAAHGTRIAQVPLRALTKLGGASEAIEDRKRVNVVQVIPELDTGGAERTTLDVAAAIVRAGGRAIVVSRGGRLERELNRLGGELVRMPVHTKNPISLAANAKALAELAEREDAQIIHARSRAPAWSALWAARMSGRAFVTTYHGAYNAKTGLKRLYNSVMARGDAVIANSEYIAERIRDAHGRLAKVVRVIPRGVDTKALDPASVTPERVAKIRAAWGLEKGRSVVLMPARLTRWKGQEVMIEALARMRRELGPAAMLIMPGDDQGRAEYRAQLLGLIAEHGLGEAVRLTGHCADMPAAYAVADVVVSASIEPEAFGRVAVEGACMGRPVVATDHGGARETVEVGVGGLLVRPGDPAAMADALIRILSLPPEERQAMGVRGGERARALFSVEAMQSATLRLYDEVVTRRA